MTHGYYSVRSCIKSAYQSTCNFILYHKFGSIGSHHVHSHIGINSAQFSSDIGSIMIQLGSNSLFFLGVHRDDSHCLPRYGIAQITTVDST